MRANANYKSLIEGQNDLSCRWVGQILHTLPDDEHVIVKVPLWSLVALFRTTNIRFHNDHSQMIGLMYSV